MDGTSPERSQDEPAMDQPRPSWLPDTPCARLIADRDWSATPLGPLASWPLSLRALLGTVLRARAPMTLLWGEQGVALYNDSCADIIGTPHPEALGRPIFESFPELSGLNAQVLRTCLAGEVLSFRETAMTLDRGRGPEPAWFDIDYLPAFGDDGHPAGALATITEITDRVAAQRRAEEDEARLRALADNLPGALVYQLETSRDLSERRYTYVSAKVEALLGIPEAEATGDPRLWLSRVCPEDAALLDEAERVAARDLSVLDVEVRSRHPDGQVIAGRVVSRPRELPDGSLVWDGMYLDVTAERAARDELERLNAHLEERVAGALAERKLWADVIEATDALVVVLDTEFRTLAANRAVLDDAERTTGRRPRIGDNIADVLSTRPEMMEMIAAPWRRAMAGEAFTVQSRIDDRDFELRFEPLRNAAGRIVAAFQIGTNVTERLRDQRRAAEAEEARREADALYRAYFRNSADGLFLIGVHEDGGFSLDDSNPAHGAMLAAFGLDPVLGRRFEDWVEAETAARMNANNRLVVATGRVHQLAETVAVGNRTMHLETVLVPVRDVAGRITRIVGSTRDRTAQVQA